MTKLSFDEAVKWAESLQVVLPELFYSEFFKLHRARAITVSGLAGLEQIELVLEALQAALKAGKTFENFKEELLDGSIKSALPKHHLETIYRTNVQTAYSKGKWEQQTRNTAARPYLMYDAINDGRTRPTHSEMDGVILPADSKWWDTHYPPNGFNCRCAVISLTESQAKSRGGVTSMPEISDSAEPDDGFDSNPGKDYLSSMEALLNKRMTQDAAQAANTIMDKMKEVMNE